MNQNNNKISLLQFILLIHGVQVGIGILSLPRRLVEGSGTDGWITLILSWMISSTASLIIIQVMKKHPNGTVIDLITHYFGKWVGWIANLLFAIYFASISSLIFLREALFIQAWILPYTEIYIIILLLSIPTYLIVRKNITILGRYAEFVFFLTAWMIILFVFPLKFANWLFLLPVVKEGWMPILSAIKTSIYSFIGFEITFFLYPYLNNKKKAAQGIFIANTLSMILLLLITIVTFVFFSPDEITIFNEPSIEMLKVIELEFIERLEIIFFSFYLFIISTTALPYLFLAVFSTVKLVEKPNLHGRLLIWFLILLLIIIMIFPPTIESTQVMERIIEPIGVFGAFIFPFVLWVILMLQGLIKRRKT